MERKLRAVITTIVLSLYRFIVLLFRWRKFRKKLSTAVSYPTIAVIATPGKGRRVHRAGQGPTRPATHRIAAFPLFQAMAQTIIAHPVPYYYYPSRGRESNLFS